MSPDTVILAFVVVFCFAAGSWADYARDKTDARSLALLKASIYRLENKIDELKKEITV